jgi:hypothetical protein
MVTSVRPVGGEFDSFWGCVWRAECVAANYLNRSRRRGVKRAAAAPTNHCGSALRASEPMEVPLMATQKYAALLAPAILAVAVAGCGGSGNKSAPKVAAKPAAPPGGGMMSVDTGAKLSVLAPRPGAVVTGASVPTDISLTHFRDDCRFAGTPNRKGVGHYHIMLDGALINMFCIDKAAVSMQNVKPGQHTLEFAPADDEHTDDMKAAKKVSFVYKPSKPLPAIKGENKGRPQVTIIAPKPGQTVHGSFVMTVRPKNFEFSCALFGKQNVKGYGHWHINIDSTKKGMMGMGTMMGMSCRRSFHVSLAGVKPGPHTFFAILEDDQHAPTIGAQDSVRLNVR